MVVMASDGRSSASPQPINDGPPSSLTIRMIMQGKEVGSIIGKKGDNVKKYREESGAKINISDSSCPERIVTVTGTTDGIYKAFSMICSKFEEDIETFFIRQDINALPSSGVPKPPVTVRLIVPASQCGSLIGKGGAKIKEIRETTGALIQVASEMLPNSTERTVTISGSADAITKCILHICYVMQESPPKGATIPYRPKPAMQPVLVAGPGGFPMQAGQFAIPAPDMAQMAKMAGIQGGLIPGHPGAIPFIQTQQGLIPAASLQGLQHPAAMHHPGQFPRHAAPAGSPQAHEMTIPNDLIGCIIGRGGSKINEIRQLSGANIKIANVEEGSSDRKVTIMGSPDTISTAQYLINASIEMHKALTLESSLQPPGLAPSPQNPGGAGVVPGGAMPGSAVQGMPLGHALVKAMSGGPVSSVAGSMPHAGSMPGMTMSMPHAGSMPGSLTSMAGGGFQMHMTQAGMQSMAGMPQLLAAGGYGLMAGMHGGLMAPTMASFDPATRGKMAAAAAAAPPNGTKLVPALPQHAQPKDRLRFAPY